jgi:serine/threonine protein kinase
MYILLEGKTPFQGKSRSETMTKVVTTKPKAPPHASPEAVDLLNKMLEKDPIHRITLEDVLKHPWLSSNISSPQQSLNNTMSIGSASPTSGTFSTIVS